MTSATHLMRTFCAVVLLTAMQPAAADNATCHSNTTKTETLICQSQDLSEFADLADVLRDTVGQDIRSAETAIQEDAGLTESVTKGLSMLTLADIAPLIKAAHGLAWDVSFDRQHNLVLINSKQVAGQGGIVVFDPAATETSEPIYATMGYVFDAVRSGYSMNDNILTVSSWAQPASGVQKFRYQDGCWRLIGEDRVWAGYMVQFDDDIAELSINYLIGLAIFDYKVKQDVRRTFDVEVLCLGDDLWGNVITYHDERN